MWQYKLWQAKSNVWQVIRLIDVITAVSVQPVDEEFYMQMARPVVCQDR
jgi:hypothetical protein